MKSFRHIAITTAMLAALAVTTTPVKAKNIVTPKAYMFGFVASFNDSIVYFTDIQEVDSVWFTQKKKMLAGRSNYSYQLRDYFANKLNLPKRTCIVIANMKLKAVEKKYTKMKKQYINQKGNKYDVRYISTTDFKFQNVNMEDSNTEQKPQKTKKSKPSKDGKHPHKDGNMPPKKN